jgi:hypothetical protein
MAQSGVLFILEDKKPGCERKPKPFCVAFDESHNWG